VNFASTSFVLGYHGCPLNLAQKVIAGKAVLHPSHNDYDWLGDGIYFWEHNADRAYQFAMEAVFRNRTRGRKVPKVGVIGAIIDLGFCLNLLDSRYIRMVHDAYDQFVEYSLNSHAPLPTNSGGADLLKRHLDCAVLRSLHQTRNDADEPAFQTVRAAFIEGDRLYENAGFSTKNHIQICVCDPKCIKGYFWPLDEGGKPAVFTNP
jgi:hypothetical protein